MCALGDWLTSEEAARISGYNIQHIRRLLRRGKVSGQKWGREWMIDKSSLLDYLKNEGRGPQPREEIDNV